MNRLPVDSPLPSALPAGLLLALLPLALASNSLLRGLVLGGASALMLGLGALLRMGFRRAIPPAIHLPIAALVLAGAISALDRIMDAYLHALHPALAGSLPLAAGAALLLILTGEARPRLGMLSPVRQHRIFFLIPIGLPPLIGAARELLASGTMVQRPPSGSGFLPLIESIAFPLAVWPAGGFILLGLLVAIAQVLRDRSAAGKLPFLLPGESPDEP